MKSLLGVYGTAGKRALSTVHFARSPVSVHSRYTLRPAITAADPTRVSVGIPAYRPPLTLRLFGNSRECDLQETRSSRGFVGYSHVLLLRRVREVRGAAHRCPTKARVNPKKPAPGAGLSAIWPFSERAP
jgi:hypothetical protein